MKNNSDKVVVITGGACGFGKAFAASFIEDGSRVYLIDLNLDQVSQTAENLGENAVGMHGDITNEARMNEIASEIAKRHGGIDLLINNAGLHSDEYSRPIAEMGIAKVRRLFDVNVSGVIICTLACAPFMKNREGASVINISSAAAFLGTAYGVSKLAVSGLTMTLAREMANDGIRVNAVAPGIIPTETIKNELNPEAMQRIKSMQYLPVSGEVQDIVDAVKFLASPSAKFITGETLRVTGGFAAGV